MAILKKIEERREGKARPKATTIGDQKEPSTRCSDLARFRASDGPLTAKLPVIAPAVSTGVREGFHGGPDLRGEPVTNLIAAAVLVFAD